GHPCDRGRHLVYPDRQAPLCVRREEMSTKPLTQPPLPHGERRLGEGCLAWHADCFGRQVSDSRLHDEIGSYDAGREGDAQREWGRSCNDFSQLSQLCCCLQWF